MPRRDMGRTPFPARRRPTAAGRTPRRRNFTPNRSGHAPLPSDSTPERGNCNPFHSGSAPSDKNFTPQHAGNAPFHLGRTPEDGFPANFTQNQPFSADCADFTDFTQISHPGGASSPLRAAGCQPTRSAGRGVRAGLAARPTIPSNLRSVNKTLN